MFTDLTEATQAYWQQLDDLEAAYHREELTIQEVDAEVDRLMTELGTARRQAVKDFWASLQVFMYQQREVIAGGAAIAALAYLWLVNVS